MASYLELPVSGIVISAVASPWTMTDRKTGQVSEGVKRTVSILPDADNAHPFTFRVRDEEAFSALEEAGFGASFKGLLRFGVAAFEGRAAEMTCQLVRASVVKSAQGKATAPLRAASA